MSDILYFNGRFTTTDEPVISVEDRGLQFGDSVYEVLKFLDRSPRFGRGHWDRLSRGLDQIGIPSPWRDWGEFAGMLESLIERTAFDDGIVYIQVTRGIAPRAHFHPEGMEPTVIAYSRRFSFPDEAKKHHGVAVVTFDDIRWKRCDIKTTSLLANVLAKSHANRSGVAESLLVDEETVIEGASSNVFVVSEGRIATPPADHRILHGVTRARVLEMIRETRISIEERPVSTAELLAADEVFLTSTTLGVMPVVSVDDRAIGDGQIGPLTTRLQKLFDDLERSDRAIDPIGDE